MIEAGIMAFERECVARTGRLDCSNRHLLIIPPTMLNASLHQLPYRYPDINAPAPTSLAMRGSETDRDGISEKGKSKGKSEKGSVG